MGLLEQRRFLGFSQIGGIVVGCWAATGAEVVGRVEAGNRGSNRSAVIGGTVTGG